MMIDASLYFWWVQYVPTIIFLFHPDQSSWLLPDFRWLIPIYLHCVITDGHTAYFVNIGVGGGLVGTLGPIGNLHFRHVHHNLIWSLCCDLCFHSRYHRCSQHFCCFAATVSYLTYLSLVAAASASLVASMDQLIIAPMMALNRVRVTPKTTDFLWILSVVPIVISYPSGL